LRNLKKGSIRSHMIFYFSILFISAISIISLSIYQYTSKTMTREILEYSTQIVDQKRRTIDSYFSRIENNLRIIGSNDTVIAPMKDLREDNFADRLYYNRGISDFLVGIQKFDNEIKDFIILDNDSLVQYYTNASVLLDFRFTTTDWFPDELSQYARVSFISSHPQGYYYDKSFNNGEVISAIIPVIDYMNTERTRLGMVLCNLDIQKIEVFNESVGLAEKTSLIVLDGNDRIIHSSIPAEDNAILLEKLLTHLKGQKKGHFMLSHESRKMVAVFSSSEMTGWKIIALSPTEELLDYLINIRTFTVILIILCILLVYLTSVFISRRISEPIFRLMRKMEKVEKGDFDLKLYDPGYDEMEKLTGRIDLMVDRINKLNRDVYSWQLVNKDTKIKALQAQINPHFLFNTLQLIKSLAVCGQTSKMNHIVTLMGNMLRYATYDTEGTVPIKQEIEHVREYMQIQDYRYPGMVTLSLNCPENLTDTMVPKFILQPIVENSIRHGFKEESPGEVEIRIIRKDEDIQIGMIDNGTGMEKDNLDKIREHLKNEKETDTSSSIGLKNVHERLRLKYGPPYGLVFKSEPDRGCHVEITIPASSMRE
jgi:two-component system, sensor histidine kinase YesM